MITILFYNDTWGMAPTSLADCPIPCRLLFDPTLLPEADLVVFHIPTLAAMPRLAKRAGQRWVAWSMESEENYPQLADPAFMRQFELVMSYRRDADVWTPYLGPHMPADFAQPAQAKSEPAPVVAFISNARDQSGRGAYLRELMQHLRVDSYGRLFHNRDLARDDGRAVKMETIARYRFTLAFENSIAPDYVTEKFYDPLIAGSVPIYLGAPDIDDYVPAERCYINVADYANPASLAAYVSHLASHEDDYASYHQWRSAGLSERFVQLAERTRLHPVTRLAMLGAGIG